MVVFVPVVERTVVVFLDVFSSDKCFKNIRRTVRNLSNTTKPKTISLTECLPLLFLQENQFRVQFKKAECSIMGELFYYVANLLWFGTTGQILQIFYN